MIENAHEPMWPDIQRHGLSLWAEGRGEKRRLLLRSVMGTSINVPIDAIASLGFVAQNQGTEFVLPVPEGRPLRFDASWQQVFPGMQMRPIASMRQSMFADMRRDDDIASAQWLWEALDTRDDALPSAALYPGVRVVTLTAEEALRYGASAQLVPRSDSLRMIQSDEINGGWAVMDAESFEALSADELESMCRGESAPDTSSALAPDAMSDADDAIAGQGRRDDYGEKIGGARKDAYAQAFGWIEDMSILPDDKEGRDRAKTTLKRIRLDALWERPRLDDMRERGVDPVVANFILMIYEHGIAPHAGSMDKPQRSRWGDPESVEQKVRRGIGYAWVVEEIRDRLAKVRTPADLYFALIDGGKRGRDMDELNLFALRSEWWRSYSSCTPESMRTQEQDFRERLKLEPMTQLIALVKSDNIKTMYPERYLAYFSGANTIAISSILRVKMNQDGQDVDESSKIARKRWRDVVYAAFPETETRREYHVEQIESNRYRDGDGTLTPDIMHIASALIAEGNALDETWAWLAEWHPKSASNAKAGTTERQPEDLDATEGKNGEADEAEAEKTPSASAPPSAPKVPSPRFDHLERVGIVRRTASVTEEEVAEKFGFRAIEYGNWVNQKERQSMLDLAYDAFADMAEALGVEDAFMGMHGRLALALGARGRGGRAAAHYETGRMVINLTKTMGAGALAHEWAHALDHWMGDQISHVAGVGSAAAFATDKIVGQMSHSPLTSHGERTYTDVLRESSSIMADVHAFMRSLVHARDLRALAGDDETTIGSIHDFSVKRSRQWLESRMGKDEHFDYAYSYVTRNLRHEATQKGIPEDDLMGPFKDQGAWAASWRKRVEQIVEHSSRIMASGDAIYSFFEPPRSSGPYRYTENNIHTYMKSVMEQAGGSPPTDDEMHFLESWNRHLGHYKFWRSAWKEGEEITESARSGHTRFMVSASALDGGKKGGYWSSRIELFARGFSSVMHDLMEEKGIRNDFASKFSAPKIFDTEEFRASSNPEGDERKAILIAGKALVEAVRQAAKSATVHCPDAQGPA